MNMVELISGSIVGGVAGVALKDKLMGADTQNETKQKELCKRTESLRRYL